MEMDPIDFKSDDFADILARDDRYDAHAYALLADVLRYLSGETPGGGAGGDGAKAKARARSKARDAEDGRHFGSDAILDEFRERALDQYGPMTYAVLTAWGLRETADIGEMMANLVESHRIGRDDGDDYASFAGAYDFEETFLGPYRT